MKKRLPIFTGAEGHSKYLAFYEAMFSLWKVPFDAIDIKTAHGTTHVNACGPENGFPLVLLHGAGLSSTAWFANIAALSTHHRVYAVDIIGDAGKSTAETLLDTRAHYAEWLNSVLDALDIDKCDLLGHSYGGWLTLNMALAYPDRLHKIILLCPAASIYPFSLITRLILYLGELRIHAPARGVLKMAAAKTTVLEESFLQLMETVSKYCFPATMYPTVYCDAELERVDLPALLLIGDGDKIYPPHQAIERAQRLMPDITAEIIPGAGHLLIMDQPAIVNSLILKFLDDD